ncbi:MAG: HAD-IA family hydrolase [Actinomycetota bacterium]
MATTTLLLDLDGVVRFFDADAQAEVERRHSLEPGRIAAIAVDPELMGPLVIGRLTRAAWVAEIGRRLGDAEAAAAWTGVDAHLDHELLAEVDRLRAAGVTVAILTNGTDTVADEVAALDLPRRVDAIFNSAELGVAKPDRRAFAIVCERLGVEPAEVFFTDDSPSKLTGARELGMTAEPYTGLPAFRGHLRACGLHPRPEPS